MEDYNDSSAHHEAGHAVACHHLGCLASVTLATDGEHRGRTDADDTRSSRSDRLLISLAGPVAEYRYDRKHRQRDIALRHYYRLSGANDYKTARDCLEQDESLGPHEQAALAFVDENWTTIHAVAEKLLQTGSLSAQEVGKLATVE